MFYCFPRLRIDKEENSMNLLRIMENCNLQNKVIKPILIYLKHSGMYELHWWFDSYVN